VAVYASQADLEAMIGRDFLLTIADFDRDGIPDVAPIAAALERASGIAETYLAAYLPLAEPYPPAVKLVVLWIAGHLLRLSRDRTTEDSRRAYDQAMAWLRDIGAGKADLLPGNVPGAVADPGDPELYAEPRLWNRTITGRLL
jgi:phage gp36-like protein